MRFRVIHALAIVVIPLLIVSGFFAYLTFVAPPPAWDRADMREQLVSTCFASMEVRLAGKVEFVRTPDSCFAELPDWPYDPQFVEIDGLRQGYVEAGPEDADVVLLLHGQPSWSYLYRFMIPVLAERGHRVIAMDHLGFGASDKPVDTEDHSFKRHAERLVTFIEMLNLDDVTLTLFAQDWGSIIGLYVAGDDLDLFDRIVIGNGGLPVVDEAAAMPEDVDAAIARFGRMIAMVPPEQPPFFDEAGNSLLPVADDEGLDPFGEWVAFARLSPSFQPSAMVEALTFFSLAPEERAAYDAPYPAEIAMAGPRSFPGLRNELLGITEDRLEGLTRYERPFLTIFGANDPGLVGEGDGQPWMTTAIPGAADQPHQRLPETSHFLQDDRGVEVAEMVDAFIRANP